jgi:hypothetical protein
MEPLRPAGLPPLSVGMGREGSKKPPEPKVEPVEEKESPFECTMGTRGVTLMRFMLQIIFLVIYSWNV